MSLDYDLCVAMDIDSDRLLRIVEDALELDHFRDPYFISESNPSLVGRRAPGFILTARADHPMCAEIREEWLGFRPKVILGFCWDKEDWEVAYCRMLRATSAVLINVPGDAALILNGETGLLIRRNGRVILSDSPRTFYPEALAEIRVPYEFGRVPKSGDTPGP